MIYLDRLPLWMVAGACLTLGLAPFLPEPHIVEKIDMLASGTLLRPIDVADLAYHALPWLLGVAKLLRLRRAR